MDTLSNLAEPLVQWLARTTTQVAVVVAAVALLTWAFKRWLSPAARCALWGLVAVRLIMPVAPPSGWSIFNWTPAGGAAEQKSVAADRATRQVETGWVITAGVEPIESASATVPRVPLQTKSLRPQRPEWPLWLALAWAVGVAAVLARIIWANLRLGRRVRRGTRVHDAWALAMLRRAARDMGVRRLPEVIETDAVGGPALAGLLRPKLLLPPGLLTQLDTEQLRFVMLHELAHLKRCDLWADWGLEVIQAVHWINPAVWWALARLRDERELARDEMVMRRTGDAAGRLGYGGTIVKVVEQVSRGWSAPRPGAVGMGRHSRNLRRRIEMIIDGKRAGFTGTIIAALAAAAVICGTLTDRTRAQERNDAGKGAALPQPVPAGTATQPREAKLPADWPQVDDPEATAAAKAIEQTRQKLEQNAELSLDNIGLSDALERWRELAGVDLIINWKSLAAAGVDEDTAASARLRGVKLDKALSAILDSAAHGKKGKLAYRIEADRGRHNAYVLVTSKEDADLADTSIVVYDIRDLLEPAADLEADADKVKAVPDEARREQLIKDVIQLLQETVDRDSWRDHGGKVGSAKHLKGQLIITQSAENHAQIKRLIDQLREGRSIQIMMEAKFLQVSEDFLKELKDDKGEALERRLIPAEPNRPKRWGLSIGILDEADVKQMMAGAQRQEKPKQATILSAPRLITFNGQKAHVTIGNEQPYVKDLKVAEKEGRKDFEPVFGTVESGLKVNLQGTVSADRKYITLSVKAGLSDFVALKSVPFQPRPEDVEAARGKKLEVQTPEMDVREAETTVSLPDGKWLMLTGLKLTTRDGKERIARDTVMLIKPTIIIQREVEQPQFPMLEKKDK